MYSNIILILVKPFPLWIQKICGKKKITLIPANQFPLNFIPIIIVSGLNVENKSPMVYSLIKKLCFVLFPKPPPGEKKAGFKKKWDFIKTTNKIKLKKKIKINQLDGFICGIVKLLNIAINRGLVSYI